MTAKHSYMTPGQVEFFTRLVNERYEADDDAGRAEWRRRWYEIDSRTKLDNAIADLKSKRPLTWGTGAKTLPARQPSVTEPGYYRNPADGTLYRLGEKNKSGVIPVSTYSKTGGPRRLDVRGNLVKGTWKTKAGRWDSNRLRRMIQADWKIDEEGLLEFAYGFCPLHGGSLSDGVSVALGYGKVCADKHGLPWSEEAARAVLGAQGIDADKFLAEHAKVGA